MIIIKTNVSLCIVCKDVYLLSAKHKKRKNCIHIFLALDISFGKKEPKKKYETKKYTHAWDSSYVSISYTYSLIQIRCRLSCDIYGNRTQMYAETYIDT